MISQLFGAFLVESGRLTQEQLNTVYETQKKVRVKLGIIAVSEKLMTTEQADEVNRLQAVMDKKFGDIAVEKGYLTDEQVLRLLGLQGNPYLSFVQAVSDNEYLSLDEIEQALLEYKNKYGYTSTDIEALKSGEADRIVPMFIPQEVKELQAEHLLVCVRAVLRLVDNNAYVSEGYFANTLESDFIAMQAMEGDKKASLSLIGEGVLGMACKFANEKFETVDLDALDAISEFINCVNGMFATKLSSNISIDIDMLPPSYKAEKVTLTGEFFVLPIYVFGKEVKIVSTFGEVVYF